MGMEQRRHSCHINFEIGIPCLFKLSQLLFQHIPRFYPLKFIGIFCIEFRNEAVQRTVQGSKFIICRSIIELLGIFNEFILLLRYNHPDDFVKISIHIIRLGLCKSLLTILEFLALLGCIHNPVPVLLKKRDNLILKGIVQFLKALMRCRGIDLRFILIIYVCLGLVDITA